MITIGNFDRARILEDIACGRTIEFDFPVLELSIQEAIHLVIDALLMRYQRTDLAETLYSSLKEMVINGVKANMKHHFFHQAGLSPDSPQELERGYELLKERLNETELVRFEAEAIRLGLSIHLTILHSPERLIALVENNTAMTSEEDLRIREKFSRALDYESIVEYYMENGDDAEGCGLGITMIVLMLKSSGIDPHAFTIDTSRGDTTVARIEIPLVPELPIGRHGTVVR